MTNTLNRRAALGSLLSTAAALAMPVPATAAVPGTDICVLIEAHKAAKSAFSEICGFNDEIEESDPRHAVLSVEYDRRCEAEENAMMDLCAFRPETMAQVRQRSEYLLNYIQRNDLQEHEFEALLESFV